MTATAARFKATLTATHTAATFATEVERTCGGSNIVRKGKVVEFDADLINDLGENMFADHLLSAKYYGGERTKLTFTPISTNTPEESTMTTPPKPAVRKTASKVVPAEIPPTPTKVTTPVEKATPAKKAAEPKAEKATPAKKAAPAKKAVPAKATPAPVVPTTIKEMTREQKRAVASALILGVGDMVKSFLAEAPDEVKADLKGVSPKVAGELIGTWLSYCPGTTWHAALGVRPRG